MDAESARPHITAFSKAFAVRMRLGFRSSRTIATMRRPAASANANIGPPLASTGLEPGSARPRASAAMCIVLAVPMPAHTPGPRIATSHIAPSCSSVMCPAPTLPTLS
jgi:hypothetical protein